MGRLVVLVVLGAGLLLGPSCSDDDDDSIAPNAGDASSSSVPAEATTSTTAAETVPVESPDMTTDPTVAEGGGWRLVVAQPTAGTTIGPVTTLCVDVAGTSREPVVVLELTLLPVGTSTGGETVRVDGSVGRGAIQVDVPRADPGRYDLRVQLIVDGERLDDVAVTVPMLTLAEEAVAADCA